jgi:sugar transferase (PEP-CTERM system associated)
MRFRIFGQYVQGSIIALAGIELLVLAVVFSVAVHARFRNDLTFLHERVGPLLPRMLLFSVSILIGLLAFGLYSPRQRARASGIFVRLIAAVAAGTALTAVIFYFTPNVWVGRGVLAFAAPAAVVALVLLRTSFARVVNEAMFKRRVLVYGAGKRSLPIFHLRRRSDRLGFVIAGFVPITDEAPAVPADRLLKAEGTLMEMCQRHQIDEIVVALDDRRRAFPSRDLIECRFAGIEITEPPTFLERETGRVCIDSINPSWMIFGHGFKRDWLRLASARALDVIASSAILALTLPLIIATAVAIKLEEGWRAPVLYRQPRVGYGGKVFPLLKFRSMRTDAERDGKARWAQKDDPRVTRVGAFIRKVRIDELPQIVNVLCGDMSFVGPRPERPQFVAELMQKIPYYDQRHCVKPGITGWAQLCYPYGASENDALQKLHYDLYYIKNNNILFDLSILVQTAEVVLLSKGAR